MKCTKLQRVQNSAARLVYRESKFCHITPLLKKLHWLPITYRIRFKIALLTYKAIRGLAPPYLIDLIFIKTGANYSLRSGNELLLNFPYVSLILHLATVLLVWQLPMFGIHFPFLSEQPPLLTILKVNLKPIILN